MKKILLLLLFTGGLLSKSYAATWYVNLNATGANNGTSWTNAFTDLQTAIGASNFGDEIWVAAGTYKPTATTTRSISFTIKNGTKVYGGFIGTETLLSQRNSTANVTILSGAIGTGTSTDNTYNVVYFSNVTSQTELDGFTIMEGYTSGGSGSGIRSADSSPIIKNCKIIGNHADIGGGLSHGGSGNITIQNCVFEGNVADSQGGAINIYVGTNNTISNCYIKSNQSNGLGGIICIAASSSAAVTISNSIIAGNSSNSSGIYFNANALLNLYNCLLVGNYSTTTDLISTQTFSSVKNNKIINCTIAHNNQGVTTGTGNSTIALNAQSAVTNSIIYGNNSIAQVLGTGLSMSNCIMQTGTNNASGTNIYSYNPNFVSPGTFASAPFDTTGYNYRLKAISPAVNIGLNGSAIGTLDLDGNTRIQNTTVDLGAYETNFCASASTLYPAAPYAICSGTPITFSVPGAVNYLWSNSAVTPTITVSAAGTFSVIFEDTSGCRGFLQATVTSSTNPTPAITFTGGSLNAGSFASYQWSYNGTPIPGATAGTHVPMEGYGLYKVDVTNAGGCSGSTTYCFSPAALSATGPTNFCPGGSVTLNVTGGTGFVWSNGEMDSSITVSTAGTYSVTVQNAVAGCAVSFQQVVTVISAPVPAITHSGGNLVTGTFTTYQWGFNGTPIPGANSQNLAPTNGNGQYTVTVTNASGCIGTSAIYNYKNLGLDENAKNQFSFYPNPLPGNGILKLSAEQQVSGNVTILIYDVTGAVSLKLEATGLPESIAFPGLKPGIYFLNIQTEEILVKGMKITVI
ncbi:hypothetical protein D3C87_83300 [compost metagenome]